MSMRRYVGLQNFRAQYGRARHSLTVVRRPIKAAPSSLKRARSEDPDLASNKMPRLSGYRRSVKVRRKPQRRRFRKRRRIPRSLTTNSKMIRVRAVDHFVHQTHTGGALEMTPVQLNSIDDPFTSTGTGQPLGYDQWKALYKKAFVAGSKVTLRFVNGDNTYNFMVGLTPMPLSQAATGLTDYEHYMEYPATKSLIVTPDMDKQWLFSKVSTRKHLHLSKLRDVDEIRVDLVNETAPADLAYWHIWSQPLTKTADPTGGVEFVVTVEYLVVLIDPVVPSRSVET